MLTNKYRWKGDDRVLNAFRQTARDEFIKGRSITDARQYEARLKLAQEVAVVIRQNLAQAEKIADKEDTWAIRMTKDIELGENDSLKNPKPMPSGKRRKCCSEEETPMPATLFEDHDVGGVSPDDEALDSDNDESDDADEANDEDYHNDVHHIHSRHANDITDAGQGSLTEQTKKRFKSRAALIQAHKQRIIPELREEDLEEMFVRGSGPGGQATNKATNRRSARKMLLEKARAPLLSASSIISDSAGYFQSEQLDQLYNPGLTKGDIKISKKRDQKRQKVKKAKKKQQQRQSESESQASDQ
ncbi:hypothetical protein FRB96_008099 [Tulasnella sp. 330]|nr:hypothetical protein FRB96_008099 [Tulasnella sp. 330]KAG8887653.1 hypothetical protein FRB98_009268 [Tulasnella sp. 332]